MSDLPHITESEWLIMHQLWEEAPLTAAEIVERVQLQKGLVDTTIKTLLRRLIAKKAVRFTIDEKNSKLYYYYPMVTEEECVSEKSRHFLSIYYRDNLEKMVTAFVDDSHLTAKEIDNLKNLLDEKKKGLHK
ncbi:BlaI/MecI/CopY family transcriptional regulator [Christensenellaceae bacterium OttesenSCG-928-M15]|nr:BlaI/MecI/CopY family transcriptional regulator [Christensenellaceae bacterium OttesenSCG-928-M15]